METNDNKDIEIKIQPILLVENDPNDVLIIKSAIHKTKIKTPLKVLENGEDAIAYLKGEGTYNDRDNFPLPILILIDLKLPRKNGHEVLEWLKVQNGLKRIPIIILSSSLRFVDVNRAYDLGVNSYIAKPDSFDSWLEIIQNVFDYWVNLNEKPELNLGEYHE